MNPVPPRSAALAAAFPFLREDEGLANEFRAAAVERTLPPGLRVCGEGDRCDGLPLVIQGVLRVHKASESGRDVTLYRIGPGESCILTASCILNESPFPASAVTETPVVAALLPPGRVRAWMDRYPAWRGFVLGLVTRRLAEVIGVVESVAFERLDRRIARLLLERAAGGPVVRMTHQAIADELGSSREVVTRLLRELEAEGLLQTGRGVLRLLDPDAVAVRAAGSG